MNIEIELNMSDERIFLSFWDLYNGNDVICELKDNKLLLSQYDDQGNELPTKEITLTEFCLMIKTKI